MKVTELLAIALGAILTNNFIFSQFLGICPFMGVSKKIDTAVGMGAALLNTQNSYNFVASVIYGITGGLGFLLAIFLFAAVREQLDVSSECPKAFEGFPIALVTAGLMALAFMGFSGLQVW